MDIGTDRTATPVPHLPAHDAPGPDRLAPDGEPAARLLGRLATSPPGPDTAHALAMLDPSELDSDELLLLLQALQRLTASIHAQEAAALAALAGAHPRVETHQVLDRATGDEREVAILDPLRDEIAAALRLSPATAHARIETARMLAGPLPGTARALAGGVLTEQHVRVIVEQACRFAGHDVALGQSPDLDTAADRQVRTDFLDRCAELERLVLTRAVRSTSSQTRALARSAVARIDRQAAERRRRQARHCVDVSVYAEDDGLAVVFARLEAADAARVFAAIRSAALGSELATECDATAGQRRAAALVALACGGTGAPSQGVRVSTSIEVVVDLETLVGLTDRPVGLRGVSGATPAPITASALRDLMEDPSTDVTLRRLVCDPLSGALLDRGRRSYAVPDRLRAFLTTRDQTCRFPGCSRAAARCQIDHVVAWEDDGGTDRDNLGALCVRHHQLKTHGGWAITGTGIDGSCTWVSPSGRRYEHSAPDLRPGGPPHDRAAARTGPTDVGSASDRDVAYTADRDVGCTADHDVGPYPF